MVNHEPTVAKSLFRLGRALLGVQSVRNACLEALAQRGEVEAAELLEAQRAVAKRLEVSLVHLTSAQTLLPNDSLIRDKVQQAERLQASLALVGAAPPSQAPIPIPQPDAFGAGVVFTEGGRWIDNRVSLEIPVLDVLDRGSGEPVLLPVSLSKQVNDHNKGELAIWVHYSDHLGGNVLQQRCAALGMSTQCEGGVGQAWSNLSTPAQSDEDIASPDEFVIAFDFFRSGNTHSAGVPAALEATGVISRVRVAGHTQFGEAFRIYRVHF